MALATDLIGLGEQPLVAIRTANGGSGPLTGSAKGTNYATSNVLDSSQYFVEITVTSSSGAFIGLPPIGSDAGALLGDTFVIINNSGSPISVGAPTSVTIFGSIGASGAGVAPATVVSISNASTYTFWPVTTTLWAGKNN